MKHRWNSNLATFLTPLLAILLACPLRAGADDKGLNEKLLAAIRDSDAGAARALLSLPSGEADANARDEDGMTALMYAAMYAGADCVELLLAKGADPNAKSNSDVTALMLAVGQADKVRLLLSKGAEVNARNNVNGVALMLAAQMGNPATVKLLLEKGADAHLRNDYGYTALMYAASAERNDLELIRVLLAKRAEINVKAKDGETALKLAGRKGRTETVRLLEKAGAKE
jgi:uncharacterized protein